MTLHIYCLVKGTRNLPSHSLKPSHFARRVREVLRRVRCNGDRHRVASRPSSAAVVDLAARREVRRARTLTAAISDDPDPGPEDAA